VCKHLLMFEPGLDLHEWETRWQELQDLAADEPEQTLSEIVRFVREMLEERGYDVDDPVVAEGDDPDIVRDFVGARELARLVEAGEATAEDAELALENLTEIYEFLVAERAPP
jgi:regulator of protease activity HflC (stomatin/prohibitin superfamily)